VRWAYIYGDLGAGWNDRCTGVSISLDRLHSISMKSLTFDQN
jgi:hypothetical protein